jgi:hypothetical protein
MSGKKLDNASVSGVSSNGAAPKYVSGLSRRIKSCDECRRHKIRCDLPTGGAPPCSRCVKNSIDCKLTKSLQSILEERQSDGEWKASVERRLEALLKAFSHGANGEGSFQAVNELQRVMQEEREKAARSTSESKDVSIARPTKKRKGNDDEVASHSPETNLGLLAEAASVGEIQQLQWDDEELAEPASAPGEHFNQLAEPIFNKVFIAAASNQQKAESSRQVDIVTQEIITLDQAFTLVDFYLHNLDRRIHSIVTLTHCPNSALYSSDTVAECVSSIRKSPFLLLSICAVASLHYGQAIGVDGKLEESDIPSPGAAQLHTKLYNEFIRISAQRSFIRHQSKDDVRALLIASWWLRDLSWIFTASSVRLATERGLQDAFKKCSDMQAGTDWVTSGTERACYAGCAVKGSQKTVTEKERTAYEEARLYYLVYIADHQAAIPFGRPPMTRQHAAVRNARAWLAGCPLAGIQDARLISQVELWVIAHDVIDDFGVDVHENLSKTQVLEQVPRFATLVDRWLIRWKQKGSNEEELEHEADMMRLFIDAHVFRAPPSVSPLLIEDTSFSLVMKEEVELRESFAYKAVPSLPLGTLNERQSRLDMGARAVESAHRILIYYQRPTSQIFGQAIYPQVMLIFACLFLNKLSKSYGQDHLFYVLDGSIERLTLPNCERSHVVGAIEEVIKVLRQRVVGRCVPEQMCCAVVPGLCGIVAESKRQSSRLSGHQKKQHPINSSPFPTPAAASSSSSTPFTPPIIDPFPPTFNFDLQTLDLLSDTRFLSGISNDATPWMESEWWSNVA